MSSINNGLIRGRPAWYSSNDGTGPSKLGHFISVIKTVLSCIFSWDRQDAAGNQGFQLSDRHVRNYMATLSPNYSLLSDFTHNTLTYGEMNELCREIRDNLHGKPLVVPLIIGQGGVIERRHIVELIIDPVAKTIEYYDPKGVDSLHRTVDGHTMREILDAIQHHLQDILKAPFSVIENGNDQQNDCHNCAAYVALYVKKRFVDNLSAHQACQAVIDAHEITAIRHAMKVN